MGLGLLCMSQWAIYKTSTKFLQFFHPPTPYPPMSTFAQPFPLPILDVHFIWSHFNIMVSSDTSIYSQYFQYTLKIDLFKSNCQSLNLLKVHKQVKHIKVKITVYSTMFLKP